MLTADEPNALAPTGAKAVAVESRVAKAAVLSILFKIGGYSEITVRYSFAPDFNAVQVAVVIRDF
jgi:hypothetical protein